MLISTGSRKDTAILRPNGHPAPGCCSFRVHDAVMLTFGMPYRCWKSSTRFLAWMLKNQSAAFPQAPNRGLLSLGMLCRFSPEEKPTMKPKPGPIPSPSSPGPSALFSNSTKVANFRATSGARHFYLSAGSSSPPKRRPRPVYWPRSFCPQQLTSRRVWPTSKRCTAQRKPRATRAERRAVHQKMYQNSTTR